MGLPADPLPVPREQAIDELTRAGSYGGACPTSTLPVGNANSVWRCAKPLILRDGKGREGG